MVNDKIRTLLIIQGVYTSLTAIWPLIDIEGFMAVTGFKTDQWLVKTVGALLIPVAVSFFLASRQKQPNWPVYILAAGSCISFAAIDFYYTGIDRIKWVYQADGFLQLLFLINWSVLLLPLARRLRV